MITTNRMLISQSCMILARSAPPATGVGQNVVWFALLIAFQYFGSNLCLAQSIFDSSTSQRLVSQAEDGLARYLTNEAELPERSVAMTEFTIVHEENNEKRTISGTQIAVCNAKTKFRRIRSFGMVDDESFEYESLWMDDKRWVYDDTAKWLQVYKFGSPEALAGEAAEDRFGTAGIMSVPLFDPRLIWTVPSLMLQFSLHTKLDEYIGPNAIQATKLNKDNSVAALFAKTDTRGVDFITEVNFPRVGMPDRFVRYAAITGNFDLQKAKEAQAGVAPLITEVKWGQFDGDHYVPLDTSSIEANETRSFECSFSHRWILGSAVKDWVFQDPRNVQVPLEKLEFNKPVVYVK